GVSLPCGWPNRMVPWRTEAKIAYPCARSKTRAIPGSAFLDSAVAFVAACCAARRGASAGRAATRNTDHGPCTRRTSILAERVVRIAVQPPLSGLGRRDHRMPARARMLGGVAVRRVVTTQGGAALLAGPQVNPPGADFHALLALAAFRVFHGANRADMRADAR